MGIIETEGLTKRFKSLVAVDHVTFSVDDGEIFGFLGPNGAGKTTTINMLTTLLKPTEGKATVAGHDIAKNASEVRATIGVVPQEFTADEDMTSRENIMLCAKLYGLPAHIAKERAEELFGLVELEASKDRKVETYSGGMRRRLELACGLINHPKILFLDEPTLGLDVQTRAAVWSYIRRLKEEYRMTLFVTTHYLEEADSLCNKIAIIDHGRIVRIGSPQELKAILGGDVIEISVENGSTDLTETLSKFADLKEIRHNGGVYRLKVKNGEESVPDVIEAVRSAGSRVLRVSLTKPTLDEVYLELTGKSLRAEQESWENVWRMRTTIRKARGRA